MILKCLIFVIARIAKRFVAKQAKCSFFRKQGEAEVSLAIHKESIDSAESSLRGSNATKAIHTIARHCETSQRLGVAIHESKIDCHESLCDSRNDEYSTSRSTRGLGSG